LLRDRNTLYRELPDGRVENVYTLKLINMDTAPHRYLVTAEEAGVTIESNRELRLQPEEVGTFIMRLQAARSFGHGSKELELRFQAEDNPRIAVESETRFLMPAEDSYEHDDD